MNKISFTQKQREKIINGLPQEFKNEYKNSSISSKAILASSLEEFLLYVSGLKNPIEYLEKNIVGFSIKE